MNVVEEILALHVFKHDEVRLTVLEEIDESDDVVVLAHFQHFNLSPLLEYLDWLHVGFLDCLDGSLGTSTFVSGHLDEAKLTFTKSLSNIVEIEQVRETHSFEKPTHPFFLALDAFKVEDARLVRREHDLYRVELSSSIWALFLRDFLDKSASQTMHDSVIRVLSVPVAEDLVSLQNGPMLLKAVGLSFQVTDPLQRVGVIKHVRLAEALVDLVFYRARPSGRKAVC